MEKYDVVVCGGGVSGIAAAKKEKKNGLKTLIIEKDTPGGQLVKTKLIKNYPKHFFLMLQRKVIITGVTYHNLNQIR